MLLKPPGQICFVTPMTGSHAGGITTQGEILFQHLAAEAPTRYRACSDKQNRYHRLWDMAVTLLRGRKEIRVQCLSVFSGPSFMVADCCSRLSRWLGQRLVLHLHGGGLPDLFARRPRWASRVLRRADVIVTPSQFLARAALALGFQARVIPNMIDLELYPYRERASVQARLYWMRSFHATWNPGMAVQVLELLRRSGVEATLVMGGKDKGQLSETQALAARLRVLDRVRFPGFLDHAGKVREGVAADIFLNTNRIDNTPVAVIEAAAMGLPVVSTNVGGVPDLLVHGRSGLLVPNEDATAMAQQVRRLLSEPELCRTLSVNGRKLAESCAWSAVRPQWLEIFRELGVPAGREPEGSPAPQAAS